MILALSLKGLLRRRVRTGLALAGVTVGAALLLDMTMLATGLSESFGELLGARGFELRITPKGTLPFDSDATLPDAAATTRRIAATPGVGRVAPLLGTQLYLPVGDSVGRAVFATGVDPAAQPLYVLLAGREPAAGEIVVSEPLAAARGLKPGDPLRIAPPRGATLGPAQAAEVARVSGIAEFVYDYAGQQRVALPLADAQRLADRPDAVSLFAVSAAPGADPDALAARLAARLPAVSVYSTRELLGALGQRLLYFQQMATILGSIALAVTALLVSTIVTIGVRERWGEIATLRAIGVRRRRLLAGVMTEGLLLAGTGSLLGVPLGLLVARRLDRILLSFPGIPAKLSFFVWNAERVALALVAVCVIGSLAGLLPGWGALRTPLGRALREEAE